MRDFRVRRIVDGSLSAELLSAQLNTYDNFLLSIFSVEIQENR